MEAIEVDKTIETIIFKETLEDMEDKIIEENTEIIGERTFSRNYGSNRDRISSNS